MERISIDPGICNGLPVVVVSRVAVQTVLEFLAAGDSIDEVIQEFPMLSRGGILACILFSPDKTSVFADGEGSRHFKNENPFIFMILFSWRGYGIGVLLLFPISLVMLLIGSVNLIGKDFTKAHFNDLLVVSSAVAGMGCWFLGRWMNKESVIHNVEGEEVEKSTMVGDNHQLWGIPFQHWVWIYWIGAVGLLLAR